MEKNCCRIANANIHGIHGGRIANPTERDYGNRQTFCDRVARVVA